MNQEQEQRLHELLCAFVLGECDANERAEIERELALSAELRAERAKIEKTIAIVRESMDTSETLSPAASAALANATSAPFTSAPIELPNPWTRVPWLRIAAGIGAVALGWAIVHQTGAKERTQINDSVAKLDDSNGLERLRGLGYLGGANERTRDGASAAPAAGTKVAMEQVYEAELAKKEPYPGPGDSVSAKSGEAKDGDAGASKPSADALALSQLPAGRAGLERDIARMEVGESNAPSRDKLQERLEVQPTRPAGEDFFVGSTTSGAAPMPSVPAQKPAEGVPPAAFATRRLAGGGGGGGGAKHASTFSSGPSGPATGGPSASGLGASPSSGGAPSSPGLLVAGRVAQQREPALKLRMAEEGRKNDEKRLKSIGYPGESKNKRSEPTAPDTSVTNVLTPGDPFNGTAPARAQIPNDLGDLQEEHFQPQQLYYWQLPVPEQQAYLDRECRRVLSWCTPRPNERPRDMFFRFWGDNPFEVTALDALSTFSVDVDTASYTLARRYLNENNLPEKAQIRTEEFVNYFKADVPPPTTGTFAIHTDLTPSRFSTDTSRQMLRVVVRGKEIPKEARKPLVLTFVIDVSGSMREQNRLEMVKHSIRLLVSQLDANDRIAVIKFSNDASPVLPMTSAGERAKIESALQPMQPEGSTNSEAGLKLGYAQALAALDPNAVNRVVFLSDGVANVGETDPVKLSDTVKPIREKGILLNTIGVGMNNHNDVFLEQLADKGDGLCNYIDSPDEAKRALVDNFTSALQPIARQVKIQVEFDPAQVLRYRLLGYENRAIADADFRNDKIDAGEVGSGHQVTALYEIERIGGAAAAASEKPLATARLRWKAPKTPGATAATADDDPATEIAQPVLASQLKTFEGAGHGYRRAAIVAQFAEILRRSIHARGHSLDDLLVEASKLQREMPDDKDFNEFVALVSKSKDLIVRNMPACDDLCQAIDAVREHQYRLAQLEQFQKERDQKLLDDLKKQNDDLEARLREMVRRRLEHEGK